MEQEWLSDDKPNTDSQREGKVALLFACLNRFIIHTSLDKQVQILNLKARWHIYQLNLNKFIEHKT